MKITRSVLWVLLVTLVLCAAACQSALAQESSSKPAVADTPSQPAPVPAFAGRTAPVRTSLLLTIKTGTYAGLGFNPPWTSFGPEVEIAFRKLEIHTSADFSPTNKAITGDGSSQAFGANAFYWVNRRLAAGGGVGWGRTQTSQFTKSSLHPIALIATRGSWFGNPMRFYAKYEFPSGTGKKQIQDSRIQGLQLTPEFRLYRHVRVGVEFGIWTYLQQGNPLSTVPRNRAWTGTALVTLKWEIPGRPADEVW